MKMRNWVILGVNENPVYLYYWPIVTWAWRTFGWEPIIFYTGQANKYIDLIYATYDRLMENDTAEMKILYKYKVYQLQKVRNYSDVTLSQVARLYGCCYENVKHNDTILTSDFDMIPLSNYWIKDSSSVYAYGRNLSNEHQPICYVSAMANTWYRDIMSLCNHNVEEMIERDMDRMAPKTKNMWCIDQDILTDNLNGVHTTRIDRKIDKRTGYPLGRVDRSAWRLDHEQYIDCHAPHDVLKNEDSFRKLLALLHQQWPTYDLKWVIHYHKEFKKLL